MEHKNDNTEYEIIDVPAVEPATDAAKNGHGDEGFSPAGIATFKKVFRGFDPKAVNEYIEVLSANLAGAQRVFDVQSDELKSSLTLISRERDNLKAELTEMAGKAAAYEQKHAECEESIRELTAVKSENVQLQTGECIVLQT